MMINGDTLLSMLEGQRMAEEAMAVAARKRVDEHLRLADANNGDMHRWFIERQSAITAQIDMDMHAYAEVMLVRLIHEANPQAVRSFLPDQTPGANQDAGGIPVYPGHDDHEHDPADGADGRDAHAS